MCLGTSIILLPADDLASISISSFTFSQFLFVGTGILQPSQRYTFYFRSLLLVINLAGLPLSPSQYIWFSARISSSARRWWLLQNMVTCSCILLFLNMFPRIKLNRIAERDFPMLALYWHGGLLICYYYSLLCFLNISSSFLLHWAISLRCFC